MHSKQFAVLVARSNPKEIKLKVISSLDELESIARQFDIIHIGWRPADAIIKYVELTEGRTLPASDIEIFDIEERLGWSDTLAAAS